MKAAIGGAFIIRKYHKYSRSTKAIMNHRAMESTQKWAPRACGRGRPTLDEPG
jgi:hypothetical protein